MRYVVIQSILFAWLLVALFAGAGDRLLPDSRGLLWMGVALCITAGTIAVVALRALGRAFRVAPRPRSDSELVVVGIYAYLRHPMYTAALLCVTGLFLMWPTWVVGLPAVANVVFYSLKARHEEQLLLKRYPDYARYRERTHGVVPFFRRRA